MQANLQVTFGSKPYDAMLRFTPQSTRIALDNVFKELDQATHEASDEFLKNWSSMKWTALLPYQDHHDVARGALLALKEGKITKSDYSTYLLNYAAFMEFVLDRVIQGIVINKTNDTRTTYTNWAKEVGHFPQHQKFTFESHEIKNYFRLTRYEWGKFCDKMKAEPETAQQYLIYPLPRIGVFSTFYQELLHIVKIGKYTEDINDKREMLVPSFQMFKNFYKLKSELFGRGKVLKLDQVLGSLEEKAVQFIKQNGKVPVGFIHPDVEDYRTYIRNKPVDSYFHVGPFVFAYHDIVYHSTRELLTNSYWCQIRDRWALLLQQSKLPGSNEIANMLIDNEGPINYFNDFYITENVNERGLSYWFKNIDAELKKFLFKDIIWHAEEYERLYYFDYHKLGAFKDEFIEVLKEETPEILQSGNSQGLFCLACVNEGMMLNSVHDINYAELAASLNSGPAYYYLATYLGRDTEEGLFYTKKAFELGYKKGLYAMQQAHLNGDLKSILSIPTNAGWFISFLYTLELEENGVILSPKQMALKYLDIVHICANQQELQACLLLAEFYLRLPYIYDEDEAFKWAKRAAMDIDYPISKRYLGDMYRLGIGVKRNYQEALTMYEGALESLESETKFYQLLLFEKETRELEIARLKELINIVKNPNSSHCQTSALPSPIYFKASPEKINSHVEQINM